MTSYLSRIAERAYKEYLNAMRDLVCEDPASIALAGVLVSGGPVLVTNYFVDPNRIVTDKKKSREEYEESEAQF